MKSINRRLAKLERAKGEEWTPPPIPEGMRLVGRGLLVPLPCSEAEWLRKHYNA